MKDQVLSIEQMQKLKELGVNSRNASMLWISHINKNDYSKYKLVTNEYELTCLDIIPTFTLQDIIKLIRVLYKKKGSVICTEFSDESLVFNLYMFKLEWVIYDNYITGKYFRDENPLIAAYNILIWLAENKYI